MTPGPLTIHNRRSIAASLFTDIDRRDDLDSPDRFDVYYGMADKRIGVARLNIPDFLPPGGIADPPEAKV